MSSGSPIIFLNEDTDSYYEAYTDGIFVGSPGLSFETPNTWTRKRLGSKVKANSTAWEESLLLSTYVEGGTFTSAVYGGNSRFLKLFSMESAYTDSIVPNIAKIFTTGAFGSGSVCYPDEENRDFNPLIGNERYFTAIFSTNGYLTSSNNGQRISNIEWQFSFPFEKKYQLLDRGNAYAKNGLFGNIDEVTFKYTTGSVAVIDRDNMNIVSVSGSLANSQLGVKTYTFYTQRFRPVPFVEFDEILPTSNEQDSSLANKVMYGIKPAAAQALTYTPSPTSGDTYIFASGAFVEGWRYGLSSGIMTGPSAIFLPDRFGQPYNLLHTSLQSVLAPVSGSERGITNENGPLLNGVTFISGAALSGEQNMWLTASIYSGSNVAAAYTVNPKCSGIYDRYCRAGMPWFDNDERLAQ